MHIKKKIIAWIYCRMLKKPLTAMARWPARIEKDYLCYCCKGCENCYSWICSVRKEGKTPFRKFRGGNLSEGWWK